MSRRLRSACVFAAISLCASGAAAQELASYESSLPAGVSLPPTGAALVYIGAFGVGTVAAMTAFAAAVGTAGLRAQPGAAAHRAMMVTAAVLALAVGGVWIVD